MSYFKISLYSNELLTMEQRKAYIDKLYSEPATYNKDKKRNSGFIRKFNNSIGFKDVVLQWDNYNSAKCLEMENPENYLSPIDIIVEGIRTPILSFNIVEFYIPKTFVEHINKKYSYNTRTIAIKWRKFLMKVFPELNTSFEVVEEKPKLSLRDFALEYFYLNIDRDSRYTIEFRSERLLTDKEIEFILPKIQTLTNYKISIHQQYCETCSEYSEGKQPFHIEIDYDIDHK